SWLHENVFKGWLAPHPTLDKALCTVCNKTIRCCKSNLIEHSQSDQHIEQINFKNLNINVLGNNNSLSHKDKVKRAEIKLAAFFAEHNIALYSANHLIPLLKDICMIPEVVSDLSLARDKCTKVITQVIAKREIEKIIINLQKCKFSILIDESTDISDKKLMCVFVQYVSPLTKKVTTQLLDLLSVDATDCSANKLFEIFKNMLHNKKIPLKNIVGMASDNASVMIGCNNSFMSRLKLEIPGLVTLNCICHSSALVASKACEKLPESCENLIRAVSTYISGSAKRCAILVEFQEFFNVERNKILKLSNTRWLILHKCIVRLLDNWEVLKNFFVLAVVEDKLQSAEIILNQLNDNFIKAYLLFLKYSLNFFNNFNALFQSRKVLIHTLFENSQRLIREIGQNFLIPQAVKCIVDLNIDDNKNIQDINNIYVGPECESFLETLSSECAQEIKLNCLQFYITAVREMLKRLPYRDTVFEQLMFLQPKIALYDESRVKFKDLTFIATRIGNIDITKLAFEWRILPSVFTNEEKEELASLEIDAMWKRILEFKNFNGEKMFQNLESLVEVVLSFPHSNAEAERIFSIVTDIKTKKRNQLSNETVSAICIIRSSFQAEDINCTNFEIDSGHLKLHNSQNLYGKPGSSSDGS
ncbi:protein FAM200A-like, partial [Linepithema humile]|uniref:protein FAM200A-like n=1 Tax=Linepithema humile TaxID=83485 RepID=UPI00351E2009